jgi:hypothetical protein
MNHVHDLLNSALSLQNIAEIFQDNAVLNKTQKSVVIQEMEMIMQHLQQLLSTLKENG